MTARERAAQYIDWPSCAPVDGERTERGIRIDGIEVWPDSDGTWLMQDGDRRTRFSLPPREDSGEVA